MAIFDQRGQQVSYQYNAAGDVNVSAVQHRIEIVHALEKLKTELVNATQAQIIDPEVATDAEYQLTKAIQHAVKPEPNKKTLLDHINQAKALIEGITAASGMVTTLIQAAQLVQRIL